MCVFTPHNSDVQDLSRRLKSLESTHLIRHPKPSRSSLRSLSSLVGHQPRLLHNKDRSLSLPKNLNQMIMNNSSRDSRESSSNTAINNAINSRDNVESNTNRLRLQRSFLLDNYRERVRPPASAPSSASVPRTSRRSYREPKNIMVSPPPEPSDQFTVHDIYGNDPRARSHSDFDAIKALRYRSVGVPSRERFWVIFFPPHLLLLG